MGDFIKTKLEVGGEVTPAQAKAIYEEASVEGASLDWDAGVFTYKDMMDIIEEEQDMSFYGSARGGEFSSLETYLQNEGIVYLRTTDSYLDYEGEIVKFDGDITYSAGSNASGEAMVLESVVKNAVKELKEWNIGNAIKILEAELFDSTIPPISVKDETAKEAEEENETEKLFMIDANYDTDKYPTFCAMYDECDTGYTRAPLEVYWDRISSMMEGLPADEAKILEDEYDRVAEQGNYIQVVK